MSIHSTSPERFGATPVFSEPPAQGLAPPFSPELDQAELKYLLEAPGLEARIAALKTEGLVKDLFAQRPAHH